MWLDEQKPRRTCALRADCLSCAENPSLYTLPRLLTFRLGTEQEPGIVTVFLVGSGVSAGKTHARNISIVLFVQAAREVDQNCTPLKFLTLLVPWFRSRLSWQERRLLSFALRLTITAGGSQIQVILRSLARASQTRCSSFPLKRLKLTAGRPGAHAMSPKTCQCHLR